jgi:uncharacterized Zn finger protein
VRDEGSAVAERGRALVREGAVAAVEVEQGTLRTTVAGCAVAITATPVPPAVWAAIARSARGNGALGAAVEGRAQSAHLEHLMTVDWEEPLVPRPDELGRSCACDPDGTCEHVAALAYAVADAIDRDPSLLLRWRGCVEAPPRSATVSTPEPTLDLTDDESWRAGTLPEPHQLRPLPVGAVLKRLGPSGLKLRGEELAAVLERAYAAFAEAPAGT